MVGEKGCPVNVRSRMAVLPLCWTRLAYKAGVASSKKWYYTNPYLMYPLNTRLRVE